MPTEPSHMETLALTAEHAARAKTAAVAEGYWPDPFAKCFSSAGRSPGPLINRGQYVRVAAIRSICEQFIQCAGGTAQIVSIGAGFDTLFWQLKAADATPQLFVELDQEAIVMRKCSQIRAAPALRDALGEDGTAAVCDHGVKTGSTGYRLLAADLNDVAQLEAALTAAGWQAEEPTLVVAELLLVYMQPAASDAVLEWFAARSTRAVFVSYDMIGPHDPFGRTMVSNLRERGCPLLGIEAIPNEGAQEARCLRVGWHRASAMTALAFFDGVVSSEERTRICRIAMLDELEEWRLLLSHYCITLAVKDGPDTSIFGSVELRKPVSQPPLSVLGNSPQPSPPPPPPPLPPAPSSATATTTYAANYDESDSADALPPRVMGSMLNAHHPVPLGTSFPEEEEAATWSDED